MFLNLIRKFGIHPKSKGGLMSLAFKIGDSAVYGGYGVGVVTAIETREIFGNKEVFYSVRIQDLETDILVPKNRTGEKGGLRPLADRKKIDEVMNVLQDTEMTVKNLRNWNKKLQEYSKKLKTGSLVEVAHVLKDLSLLQKKKNLSFGEKQIMEQAWNLLSKEVTLVMEGEDGKVFLKDASQIVFPQ